MDRSEQLLERLWTFMESNPKFRDDKHGIDFTVQVFDKSIEFTTTRSVDEKTKGPIKVSRITVKRFCKRYIETDSLSPDDYAGISCAAYLVQVLKDSVQ
jgi:hypothetical protein